ncbi:MAG: hypothetical protein ACFHW5_14765 [Verrucomicrobiota bacterium]|jgi:hypothetical protein
MVKLAEKSKSIYDIAHNLICGKLRKTGKTQTPDVAIEELVQLTGVTKELATDAVEYIFFCLEDMSGTFDTEEEADENARELLWFVFQEK